MAVSSLVPPLGERKPGGADSVVVVPTYNEAGNVRGLIERIMALEPRFDVLIVDDNSPDGTADLVSSLAEKADWRGRIGLLRRAGKLGLGTAYRTAFRALLSRSEAEFIFQMDADLSHPPEDLPTLRKRLDEADVVIGSRYVDAAAVAGWPLRRLLLSRFGNAYSRLILGRMPIADATGGFKGFRRAVLERIDLEGMRSTGYSFQIEMNYRCFRAGFRLVEVPIVFADRMAGRSKMSWRIVAEALVLPWALRLSISSSPRS